MLREAGFAVSRASTAEEALTRLRSFQPGPDVIVSDHVLPGASGSAFVRPLREICPRVPVIAIRGMIEAESEYEGLHVIFLRKPCPPDCLIGEVHSPLAREPPHCKLLRALNARIIWNDRPALSEHRRTEGPRPIVRKFLRAYNAISLEIALLALACTAPT